MSKRRTPQQKKDLEYSKDHYVIAEYPHHFRRSWPKKKQRVNQAHRHEVHQALAEASTGIDSIALQDQVSAVSRRPFMHPKWGVVSLRERVELRQRKRWRAPGVELL